MDELFWGTLGFIFLTAIVSAFIRARQRDACLALLHDHLVTLVLADGRAVWGDLRVFARGLQLAYSAPHRTRRGTIKSGYLLYHKELGQVLALCRYTGRLNPDEARERLDQIERTFNPNLWRRLVRGWRNVYATLRDAFGRALGMVVGKVVKTAESQVLTQHSKDVEGVGKNLLDAAGEAYEPMLEHHIGQPVILEATPAGGGERIEIDGYLAEYTEDFIAIFNVEHPAEPAFDLAVDPAAPPEADALPPGVGVELGERHLRLTNSGRDFLFVGALTPDGQKARMLGATLAPRAHLKVARPDGPVTLRLERVPSVDLVCPRAHATVRYMGPRVDGRADGIVPLQDDETAPAA